MIGALILDMSILTGRAQLKREKKMADQFSGENCEKHGTPMLLDEQGEYCQQCEATCDNCKRENVETVIAEVTATERGTGKVLGEVTLKLCEQCVRKTVREMQEMHP